MSQVLLQVERLGKTYFKDGVRLEVLREISFAVSEGEVLAIVGASGAGKSTLLHIMGALDRPTCGEIYFQGTRLSSWNEEELAAFRNRSLGFVFQFHHLLPEFSACENVMLPQLIAGVDKEAARVRAEELLSEVGLAARVDHRPGELSGGEQQRVALARALANQPQLILADEPTGNLDSKTGEAIYALMRKLNEEKGITFVYVTHNERLAAQADRIVRLADGRLV